MALIDYDLLFEILKRLPVKSLIRFKATSKSWRYIIESPLLVKMQSEHHARTRVDNREKILLITTELLEPEWNDGGVQSHSFKFHLLNQECLANGIAKFTTLQAPPRKLDATVDYLYECSCNGMILLNYHNLKNNDLILWNPSTRNFGRILVPPIKYRGDSVEIFGLGFDSILRDYKIVRIGNVLNKYTHKFDVRVFTFKMNSWTFNVIPIALPHQYKFFNQSTVLMNGAVHFVAKKINRGEEHEVILAFNLSTEKFAEIQLPSRGCVWNWSELSLKGSGGRLFAQWWIPRNKLEIWTMMDYGISNSWIRILMSDSIFGGGNRWRDLSNMVTVMPNGDILVGQGETQLLLYDMKRQVFSEIKNSEFGGFNSLVYGALQWELVSYVESLLSPHDLIASSQI